MTLSIPQNEKILLSLFNQPACSDIILSFNSVHYYLISNVIKEAAPALLSEIVVPQVLNLATSDDKSIEGLTAMLMQNVLNKKLININDLAISDSTVKAVLEHLYGKSIEGVMTVDNVHEFFALSQRFGGIDSVKVHFDKVVKDFPNDKFASLFLKATSYVHPCVSLNELIRRLPRFTSAELELYIPQLSLEVVIQLLSSDDLECTENMIFQMATLWCHAHNDNLDSCSKIMACIKFEHLELKILTTAVKSCPFVKPECYLETLEKVVMTRVHDVPFTRKSFCWKFAIGKVDGNYIGYRLVTMEDIYNESFRQMFDDSYIRFGGIPSLDTFISDIVCGAGWELRLNNWYIRTESQYIKKQNIVKFYTRQAGATPEYIKANLELIEFIRGDSDANVSKTTGLYIMC